jgi:hypothetical protein
MTMISFHVVSTRALARLNAVTSLYCPVEEIEAIFDLNLGTIPLTLSLSSKSGTSLRSRVFLFPRSSKGPIQEKVILLNNPAFVKSDLLLVASGKDEESWSKSGSFIIV